MSKKTNITKIDYVSNLLTKVQRIEQTIEAIPTNIDDDNVNFSIDSVYVAVEKLERQLKHDLSLLQDKATDIINETETELYVSRPIREDEQK